MMNTAFAWVAVVAMVVVVAVSGGAAGASLYSVGTFSNSQRVTESGGTTSVVVTMPATTVWCHPNHGFTVAAPSGGSSLEMSHNGGSNWHSLASPVGVNKFGSWNSGSPPSITLDFRLASAADDDIDHAPERSINVVFGDYVKNGSPNAPPPPAVPCYTAVKKPTTSMFAIGIGDDETADILLSLVDTVAMAEGSIQTFKVKLATEPASGSLDVGYSLSWDGPSPAPPPGKRASLTSPSSPLTFTSGNWNTKQTITVIALQDDIDYGATRSATIAVSALGGGEYAGISTDAIGYSFVDDDVNGFALASQPSSVNEGSTASYTLALTAEPQGDVRVDVSASPASACTAVPSTILYSPASYGAIPITVTGVDDEIDDGDNVCTVAHTVNAAATVDDSYDSLTISDVVLTVVDVDVAGVSVSAFGTSFINEDNSGPSATLTVALDSKPLGDVTVTVTSSDTSSLILTSPATLTFEPTGPNAWNIGQTVTFAGVVDGVVDDDATVTVTVAATASTSSGEHYDGNLAAVTRSIDVDNVDAPDITVASLSLPPTVTEGSTPIAFDIELHTGPSANVVVAVALSDPTQATLSVSSVTFSPANFSTAARVFVTAVDDAVAENLDSITLTISPSVCAHAGYNGVAADPASFDIDVVDNDNADVLATPVVSGWPGTLAEDGAPWAYSVVLTSEPTADVTVVIDVDVTGQVTLNATSLTFTDETWNVAQAVSVTPIDELVYDGPQTLTIATVSITSGDPIYDALVEANGLPHFFDLFDNEIVTVPQSWTPESIGIRQSPIEITFSSPVLAPYRASAEAAFLLVDVPTSTPVPVTFTWMGGGSKLKATPVSELTELIDYRFSLDGSVAESMNTGDSLPSAVAPLETTFDVVRLIAFVRPLNGAVDTALNEPFVFFFDQPMNRTLTEASIAVSRLDGPHDSAHMLNGTWEWSPSDNVVEFSLDAPLEDTVAYRIVFEPTLATQPIGSSQTALELSFTLEYTFTTVAVPPRVASSLPASGATGVAQTATITVTFDEVMDLPATAAALTVLYDSDGAGGVDTRVDGTVAWSVSAAGGSVLAFVPAAPLADDANHEIRVSTNATDVPGNALAAEFVAAFRTVDRTPPTVVALFPADGQANVGLADTLQITFSEVMAAASGTVNGAVTLTATASGTPVVVTTAWVVDSGTTVLEVTSLGLESGIEYTLDVTSLVADASGNALAAPVHTSFHTVCAEELSFVASVRTCACIAGFFGPLGGPCTSCPENAVCVGGNTAPASAIGHAPSSSDPLLFQPCVPPEACGFNSTCTDGYTGAACAECAPRFYRLSQRCEACPNNAWLRWSAFTGLIVLGCILLLLGLVFFMRSLVKKGIRKYRQSWASRMAVITIGLNFAQVLAILAAFELRWPSSVLTVFSVFSVFNFNLELMATDCDVGLPYEVKWSVAMVTPLAVAGLLALFTAASHMARFAGRSGIPWSLFLMAIVALASFAYMFLAAKAVEFFDCTEQADGKYLLDADPSLECYTDWWMTLLPAAATAVLVYVIGIPGVFAFIMYKYRNSLEDTRSAGFAVFGVISSRFRPHLAFYELVIMLRKLAILIALLMVSDSPPVQAFIAQISLVLGLAVHQKAQPYNSKELNYVESALLVSALCVLSAGQVFYTSRSDLLSVVVVVLIIGCTLSVVAVAFYAIAFRHTHYTPVKSNQVVPATELAIDVGSSASVDDGAGGHIRLEASAPTVSLTLPMQPGDASPTSPTAASSRRRQPRSGRRRGQSAHAGGERDAAATGTGLRSVRSEPRINELDDAGQGEADVAGAGDSYSTCSVSVHSMAN